MASRTRHWHGDLWSVGTMTEISGVNQDGTRNMPQIVTAASAGLTSPSGRTNIIRTNDDGTVLFSDPAAYETVELSPPSTTPAEFMVRFIFQRSSNLALTGSSPKKIHRFFNDSGAFQELYGSYYSGSGIVLTGAAGGSQFDPATYWGDAPGDDTTDAGEWHEQVYYILKHGSAGIVRVWHEGILVFEHTGETTNSNAWFPLYLTSNWSDAHDATNHHYWDEIEIFDSSDVGDPIISGSMSAGTATAEDGEEPPVAILRGGPGLW